MDKQKILEQIYEQYMFEAENFDSTDVREIKIGHAFSVITYLNCFTIVSGDKVEVNHMWLSMLQKFSPIDDYMIKDSTNIDNEQKINPNNLH